MAYTGTVLRDARTVLVGPNSTQIVGTNAKRLRVSIYPVSATSVWISLTGTAVASQGPEVVRSNPPLIFGGLERPGEFTESIQAISAGGVVPVFVIDEFMP